ncbi:TspO/MBR family protein [Xanthomonas sp. 60]
MPRRPAHPLPALLGWLLLCFAVAALGAVASVSASSFYASLVQPRWAPPGSVFGPVWSVLYALMAVAAWRVWRRGGWRAQAGTLSIFLLQLALNGLWSWLFFAWHQGALAFLDIVVLWATLLLTVRLFWRADRLAAVLMLPYLAWITFAAALNWAVWQANPAVLG